MKTEILPVEVAHSPHVLSPPSTTPTEQKGQEAGLLAAIQKMKIANGGLNSKVDADKQKSVESNVTSSTSSAALAQVESNGGLLKPDLTPINFDTKTTVSPSRFNEQNGESIRPGNGDEQGPKEAA